MPAQKAQFRLGKVGVLHIVQRSDATLRATTAMQLGSERGHIGLEGSVRRRGRMGPCNEWSHERC